MRRWTALVFGIVIAATLAACGGGSNDAQATGTTARPTAATAPTGATGSATSGPTAATGTTATGPSGSTGTTPALEDGRHFGDIKTVDRSGSMTFDLAYFYTGDEANRIAAERGDETPVPNDYYIVNDNPRLRTLAIAPDADIEVFDWNRCCDDHVTIDLATFADVISSPDGSVEVDGHLYNGQTSPYWVTVESGVVTKIEEQFLP